MSSNPDVLKVTSYYPHNTFTFRVLSKITERKYRPEISPSHCAPSSHGDVVSRLPSLGLWSPALPARYHSGRVSGGALHYGRLKGDLYWTRPRIPIDPGSYFPLDDSWTCPLHSHGRRSSAMTCLKCYGYGFPRSTLEKHSHRRDNGQPTLGQESSWSMSGNWVTLNYTGLAIMNWSGWNFGS